MKMSEQELKDFSKKLQELQKDFFGNKLSKAKNEAFLAKLFGYKNYNTLIGTIRNKSNPIEKKPFRRTIIQVEVLSEGDYDYSNLEQVHYDITFGDFSGLCSTKEVQPLSIAEMVEACEQIGSDPMFFGACIVPNEIKVILKECSNELYKDNKEIDSTSLYEKFEELRSRVITQINRRVDNDEIIFLEKEFEKYDHCREEWLENYILEYIE